jgi:hypothetical protein
MCACLLGEQGIRGVSPCVFGNGRCLVGAQPVEHFERPRLERRAEGSSICAYKHGQSRPLSHKTPGFEPAPRGAD